MMRAFVKSATTTALVVLVACAFFVLITVGMMVVR
jgi:hypothetical protein